MWKYIIAVLVFAGIVGGSYYKGRTDVEAKYEAIREQDRKRIAELENKQTEVTTKVVTEYVDRVKTVKQKEYVYVEQAKNGVPQQSIMSTGWVYLHDSSARGKDADATRASDAAPSSIGDNQALAVVVTNYSRCIQQAHQLESLQNWISEQKKAIDESNEKRKAYAPD